MIRINLEVGATIYDTNTGKYISELDACTFLNRIYYLIDTFLEPDIQCVKLPDFVSKNLSGECTEMKLSDSKMTIRSAELYNKFINECK